MNEATDVNVSTQVLLAAEVLLASEVLPATEVLPAVSLISCMIRSSAKNGSSPAQAAMAIRSAHDAETNGDAQRIRKKIETDRILRQVPNV
jgi:hypothetical protein